MSEWNEEHAARLDAMCGDRGYKWDHSPNDVAMLLAVRDRLAEQEAEIERLKALAAWQPIATYPNDDRKTDQLLSNQSYLYGATSRCGAATHWRPHTPPTRIK